jgi:hypothetical protein
VKKCSKCQKEKGEVDFNFKKKALGIRQIQCKECTRLLIKNHYNKNRKYYLDKAIARNSKLRLEIHSYLRNLLSNKSCVDCGELDIRVLEFDHKNGAQKFRAVSHLIRARFSLEKIKEEIGKCEIRCANCHRKKTSRDFKWYKN